MSETNRIESDTRKEEGKERRMADLILGKKKYPAKDRENEGEKNECHSLCPWVKREKILPNRCSVASKSKIAKYKNSKCSGPHGDGGKRMRSPSL